MKRRVLWACPAICVSLGGIGACSHGSRDIASPPATPVRRAADPAASMDSYYLSTCAVCGGMLGTKGESPELIQEGRRLRVCCDACAQAFNRAPAANIERIDAVMILDQRPHYPLKVSLVSGDPLGPNPEDFIWGNRLFRASGWAERDLILDDPVRYVRLLDQAVIAAQSPTYGMPDKCPVQGDILPTDEPFDIVVANRMIRVCCGRCARVVQARPYQYLGMVDYANRHPRSRVQP
ncbi:MAG: hypothetical protein IT435_15850 [Phycisphaerales bacterium]|nr:hypothetical protein [Phycisphaerales bacterium]